MSFKKSSRKKLHRQRSLLRRITVYAVLYACSVLAALAAICECRNFLHSDFHEKKTPRKTDQVSVTAINDRSNCQDQL